MASVESRNPTLFTPETESESKDILDRTEQRAERSAATFAALEGKAWESVPSGGDSLESNVSHHSTDKSVTNLDGSSFVYDPACVEVREIYLTTASSEAPDISMAVTEARSRVGRDWQYMGKRGTTAVLARPLLHELDVERVPGVDITVSPGHTNLIRSGTLEMDIAPPPNVPALGRQDEVVEVIIRRAGQDLSDRGRNPHAAEPTFPGDIRRALKQLEFLGYHRIIAHPTDSRRRRIYEKVGMVPLSGDDPWTLVGRIEDLRWSREDTEGSDV